jgi:hypothetical protein
MLTGTDDSPEERTLSLSSGAALYQRASAVYSTLDAAADERGVANIPARQARVTATKRRSTTKCLPRVELGR